MSTNANSAQQFFEACETGKGWEACSAFCHPDATFSSQTAVLADISTLEGYCEWMKNLFTPIPDGHYELKFFAADDVRNSVAAFAVFKGTQTGEGGPVPATGVGSEEAPTQRLASVRRSNWTCGFPASSFHKAALYCRFKEGINLTRFTSPSSPYNFALGRFLQPLLRQRL